MAFEVTGGLGFPQSKGESQGKAARIWVHGDYKKPASQEYSSWSLCCEKLCLESPKQQRQV